MELLTRSIKTLTALFVVIGLSQCTSDKKPVETPEDNETVVKTEVSTVKIPVFNADSAYHFVQKQVDFGPRVPNSRQHADCANYLVNKLYSYCDSAFIQFANAKTWDNVTLNMMNIIGVINPEKKERILLSAHWDTRPWADEDEINPDKPILGANDGASGVAVILEIARHLKENRPELGIDIIFFDAEDWGKSDHPNSFCLGSQYWSKNPHDIYYRDKLRYGINLDMVGGKDAVFAKEGESMLKAKWVMDKVWQQAQSLGHNMFINYQRQGIIDDHFYINNNMGVSCIDIINYDVKSGGGFGEFWHTHDDDMDVIDKNTLHAVGETVLHVIYKEKLR